MDPESTANYELLKKALYELADAWDWFADNIGEQPARDIVDGVRQVQYRLSASTLRYLISESADLPPEDGEILDAVRNAMRRAHDDQKDYIQVMAQLESWLSDLRRK